MRKFAVGAISVALAATPLLASGAGAGATDEDTTQEGGAQQFVVLYTEGVTLEEAHAAVEAAGGTVVSENTAVGVATVTTTNAQFAAEAASQPAIEGTAENRVIAAVPRAGAATGEARKQDPAEADLAGATVDAAAPARSSRRGVPTAEPLAGLQWDMQQIGATPNGSYQHERGDGVVVGILDTGVDGTHPDIAPNFDAALSRNFTVDIPVDANGATIDGPCAAEPDQSCNDPANVDESGHGTHVASTIASPINGLGIAGVAPEATIVNLRAGQDSGYFFLQPSVDALTYAGDNGVDVVNMSYYVDPWLFNCVNHPSDSAADQAEQRTIITAMQRALTYARSHGVTLVSSAGNEAIDYTKVVDDATSPDFADVPGEQPRLRTALDPVSCVSMPAEGDGVITVSATGISTRKAYYSSYGNGYIDIAAPGGDVYDTPTNTRDITKAVLAAMPTSLVPASQLDPSGNPVPGSPIVRSCSGTTCAYYQYLQGTSMASPHVAGVAALVIGKRGLPEGGSQRADLVERLLLGKATNTSCPEPPAFVYTRQLPSGATVTATHVCEGDRQQNGFYGYGIVSARRGIGG